MKDENLSLENYFDRAFYLQSYPDIAKAGIDPFEHYCTSGWREGRNPSVAFDTQFYLQRNPDIAEAGINPLDHYVFTGRHEGRQATPPMGGVKACIQRAFQTVLDANHDPVTPAESVMSVDRLSELLAENLLDGPTILSVSHDDYRVNVGGVQKLISVEQHVCADISWNYLHLSPAVPQKGLANQSPGLPFAVSVHLNGKKLGNVTSASFIKAFLQTRAKGEPVHAIVHHLMGHDPTAIGDIIEETGCDRVVFWVHDFFTLCSGIQLLRNDIVYCHAPSPASMACGICCHGEDRPVFLARIGAFFSRFTPFVMAPSEAALAIWRKHSSFSHEEALARPLGRLLLSDSRIPFAAGVTDNPIRIAFLGLRNHIKGWMIFQNLALHFRNDSRYEFHHIGLVHDIPAAGNIIHTPVNIATDGEDAMIQAVSARNIDVVINWSLWPETFCYAAYEALAGGAFVLAPDGDGNVPIILRQIVPEQGLLLKREEDLSSLLSTGKLSDILKLSNRRRGYLLRQGDSVTWLRELSMDQTAVCSEANLEMQDD
ncbi:hypothetical protein NKW53_05505 [Acetobacter orientalis]|uniref:hypothetical protein n=1 Tax=Acetobacter orientalis TaxID=146474 RepID=UPI00209D127C|nr:hypothetical protein [Acetobacter orientalis]MCP1215521.1 hypothetical protein [Acetobacter orientalis]MCP1217626.1 hypothetical protein [Acetobacter orientalis]